MSTQPSVLFVCVHNAGRSQMAQGFLTALAGDAIEVRSAGSAPGSTLNPVAVEAMAELGIDITHQRPKILTPDAVETSTVVITMGCGDACPYFPGVDYRDWSLPDPAGQNLDAVRPIRDEIRSRVEALITELLPDHGERWSPCPPVRRQHDPGQFGRGRGVRVDGQVVRLAVFVDLMEVPARQPLRGTTGELALIGDRLRTGDSDELDPQTGQGIEPHREQVGRQQHLVDDQMIPALREGGRRPAGRLQHPASYRAVADDHPRVSVRVGTAAVVPEAVPAERPVYPTAPFRRHQTEERVDSPVDERHIALVLHGPRQRGLARTRRAVEKDDPREKFAAGHRPTLRRSAKAVAPRRIRRGATGSAGAQEISAGSGGT